MATALKCHFPCPQIFHVPARRHHTIATLERLGCPRDVTWELVAAHARQAERNHSQSVERLAERGGLAPLELAAVLWHQFGAVRRADAPRLPADYSNTKALGKLIYTHYLYAFEIAAFILLAAMVAAVALTLRRRKDTKYFDPGEAVKVKSTDRVRLVRMASESVRANADAPAEKE